MDAMICKLLEDKATELVTAEPRALVVDAVQLMNARRIGSVLVMEGDSLRGIFTERDVLTRVVAPVRDPAHTRVEEVMTRDPTTVTPETKVGAVMQLMTERRFRHVPVVQGGRVIAMLSIGDLTRWVSRDQRLTIDDLTDYIVRAG
jgi:CBS domain-containing protein